MARSRRRARRGHWQSFKKLVALWVDLFQEHNLLTFATAIALQAFVALVALILLGVAVLGAVGKTGVWNTQIAPRIEPKVLVPVFGGIDATVQRVFEQDSTSLIVFASLLSIWEVSGAVRACMSALSRIYGTQDDRPWWVRFPLSIAIAVVVTAALAGAVVLVLGLKGVVHGSWSVPVGIGRWLLALGLLVLGFGVLVRFAPAERRAKRWATGGATLVVVAWVVQSLIFAWYVSSLGNYRTAAGSLTAIYVVTTYLYVGAIVLLVGIELDEQLRRDVQGEDERGILELVKGVL